MRDYLLMRLYSPLASWGEMAAGEKRHTATHPSRSALLGLLGAALGIERSDDASQEALNNGYRFGIFMQAIGAPLQDYHTINFFKNEPTLRRGKELCFKEDEKSFVTRREYRCDSVAIVAVEALPSAPKTLDYLEHALKNPHFVLYLGRKSCPLAEPLLPQKIQAHNLKEAFEKAKFPSLLGLSKKNPHEDWPSAMDCAVFGLKNTQYYWEDGMEAGMDAHFVQRRNDQPLSRQRWQFASRKEYVALQNNMEQV